MPYYGGKTKLADRIVSLLPRHDHYVEPFAGGLSVLLAKPRSHLETVNDIDGNLMTFWRVVRDRPDDLARAMALTPHSRAEHLEAYDLDTDDEIERARRVWVMLSQGRGSTMRPTGWRFYSKAAATTYSMPDYLAAYVRRVPDCAARLHGVSLENRSAFDLIRDYGRDPDTLLYCDPPYLGSTRSSNYRHEMTGYQDHHNLAAALEACEASVVLSGYHSPLYEQWYRDWHRTEIRAWTGNGIASDATKTDGDRVEVLWSNRPPHGDQGVLEVSA